MRGDRVADTLTDTDRVVDIGLAVIDDHATSDAISAALATIRTAALTDETRGR